MDDFGAYEAAVPDNFAAYLQIFHFYSDLLLVLFVFPGQKWLYRYSKFRGHSAQEIRNGFVLHIYFALYDAVLRLILPGSYCDIDLFCAGSDDGE